jgi:cell division protein FtsI/penicillin-binding protein 2
MNSERHSLSHSESFRRYLLIATLFLGVAIAILFRLFYVEFSPKRGTLIEQGQSIQTGYHIFFPARGDIYDRWGNLLAGSRQVYEVGVDLYNVVNPESIAFTMKSVMADNSVYGRAGYYGEVLAIASQEPTVSSSYAVVADFVSEEELEEIKQWSQRYQSLPKPRSKNELPQTLTGLVYRPRLQRIYPEGKLAANVLGYVGWDGEGVYGVEEIYNDQLAGTPVHRLFSVNPYAAGEMPTAEKGSDLVLTIDRKVQAAVEEILEKALDETGSDGGTILVMDPRNGEILAMASTPRIDINRYWQYPELKDGQMPFNKSVNVIYEPGSVFKVLTMAAAIDAGIVSPDSTFLDTGSVEVGGIVIHNWNYGAWGEQTMTGCMQHSLNVCLASVAMMLGETKFYQYMNSFGLGRLTGIDLSGEVPGRLKLPGDGDWHASDLGTNSFGQGVAVTPVQMLQAVSALANDGEMVSPHIMKGIVNNDRQYNPVRTTVGMPISAETARTITDMLAISLEQEASNALVPGYRVAGKTGTAEIVTPTGYSSSQTNASFVGWGPADDPQILVYIWLEKPTISPWGSVVAAPVFSEVFKEVAILTNLPPDDVRQQLANR